ncbi:hypothetical protein GCM10009753_37000 [Streptantibioticus ferralitis]
MVSSSANAIAPAVNVMTAGGPELATRSYNPFACADFTIRPCSRYGYMVTVPSAVSHSRRAGTSASAAATRTTLTANSPARMATYSSAPTCRSVAPYSIDSQSASAMGARMYAIGRAMISAAAAHSRTARRRSHRKCSGFTNRPATNQGRNCSTRESARSVLTFINPATTETSTDNSTGWGTARHTGVVSRHTNSAIRNQHR